jgi:hypothetical protein
VDAAAYLALLSKAKRVFESEATFLSFPVLSQLTYDVADLRFSGDEPAAQRLAALSEFSRVTNRIQRGVVAAIDGDEYLWDVYDDILSNAEVADPVLTEEQEKECAAAFGLLYTETAEGLKQDSPALASYKSLRDSYIHAVEEYRNRQLTADLSADPAVKAQWVADEPELQQAIADIEASWQSTGRRAEVEAAQQVERSYNAKAPALRWDDWRESFVADLDLATDTNQIRFAATVYSPSDVFDRDDWLRFTLAGDEIVALCDQAPEELREIVGDVATASAIESVSFEYRSVALDRAWLERSVFESRFWRLGPDGGELSDGGDPPNGRCPAYAVALVFARRITVTWTSAPPAGDEGTDPRRLLVLRPDLLQRLRLPRPVVVPRPRLSTTLTGARPGTFATLRRLTPLPPAATQPSPQVRGAAPRLDLRLTRMRHPLVTGLPEPAPEEHPPSSSGDDVTILGFLCKRVPRCPDPDPSLDWV